ncbi:MAG: hypothetical protein P8I97_13605 [Verrucomicrobiales bacterium]|nr:hypothetical protein [Verrucomicrobiales bacterium]
MPVRQIDIDCHLIIQFNVFERRVIIGRVVVYFVEDNNTIACGLRNTRNEQRFRRRFWSNVSGIDVWVGRVSSPSYLDLVCVSVTVSVTLKRIRTGCDFKAVIEAVVVAVLVQRVCIMHVDLVTIAKFILISISQLRIGPRFILVYICQPVIIGIFVRVIDVILFLPEIGNSVIVGVETKLHESSHTVTKVIEDKANALITKIREYSWIFRIKIGHG